MTRTEKAKLDRKPAKNSSVSPKAQDCAQMFCATLANLNRIYEEQLSGFARIAITLSEISAATSSPKRDEKTTTGVTSEELTAFLEQLRSVAEARPQTHAIPEVEVKTGLQNPVMADAFCAKVEYLILLAMQNSVNQQQQLCITGQAILATGAAKLFSVSPTPNSNKKT